MIVDPSIYEEVTAGVAINKFGNT